MTSSALAVNATDARRDTQRRRIMTEKLTRSCPKCGGNRLFPQAGINNRNKAICYDCGGRFRKKV